MVRAAIPIALCLALAGQAAAQVPLEQRATSSFSFAEDARGCPTTSVTNSRFLFAPGEPGAGILLREAVTTTHCMTAEGSASEIGVEAHAVGVGQAPRRLFSLRTEGHSGSLELPFYRATRKGCCGVADLDLYFSLEDGRERFTSSGPLLRFRTPDGEQLWVTVTDSYSATALPEQVADSTVVAVLQYGDGGVPARRMLVRHPHGGYHGLDSLYVVEGGKRVSDLEAWMSLAAAPEVDDAARAGTRLVLVLTSREDPNAPLVRVELPMSASGPTLTRARVSPLVRLDAR